MLRGILIRHGILTQGDGKEATIQTGKGQRLNSSVFPDIASLCLVETMKLADSFKLSINSVLHRQLRAWLTLLGIVIGVAAVISIISIGEGAQASVSSRLSSFGADVITLSAGFSRGSSFGGEFREPPSGGAGRLQVFGGGSQSSSRASTSTSTKTPTLTKRDSAIITGNPDVLYVNEIVSGRGTFYFLAEQTNATVQGVNPLTWAKISTISLASGRLLTPSDASGIVIGDRIANKTFKQPVTLGRKVTIEDKVFTVVGILKSSGTSGFGGGGSDSVVYMPYTSAWQTLDDVNVGVFSSIQVKVRDAASVDADTNAISQALIVSRRVTERTKDFTITSEQAIQEQISSVTETLTAFLGAIAAVSLLVGAVGIANSMFTSVLEKTKEIGILKALGSTNGEILKLFIIESGLFGFIGGIIGAIFGIIGSFLLSFVGIRFIPGLGSSSSGGLSTLVTPQLVIGAIILSTIIGMVAGFFPARSAAKLRPVDALRYE